MTITGISFRDMVVSAASALENNKEEINNLNVYPVPDGDTGVNMSMTMSRVRTSLSSTSDNLSECAKNVAGMTLMSARGNSGVILAMFFRGMSKAFAGLEEADSVQMAEALKAGVTEAYKAVMTPTEGTILTVMRVCAEKAMEKAQSDSFGDIEELFDYVIKEGIDILNKTPELLPILKQANVVDAGGKGFVVMLQGMLAALRHHPVVCSENGESHDTAAKANFDEFSGENIEFLYCTECIVKKSAEYIGEDTARELYKTLLPLGNSMVFVDDENVIKLHIHTNEPGTVLSSALRFGTLLTVKIENMLEQHSSLAAIPEEPAKTKKYGFVSVCNGDGIRDVFADLGVDGFVLGGQSMNPSTKQIIDCANSLGAENIFILPNNKNVYLVAAQAAEELGKNVRVIPSNSVPAGISAMMSFDPEAEADENFSAMTEAASAVKSLTVTRAVRDCDIDGLNIAKDNYMGLVNGKIKCVAENSLDCLKQLTTVSESENFTVFTGSDVNDVNASKAADTILGVVPDAEVTVLVGGQPLYDYVIMAD